MGSARGRARLGRLLLPVLFLAPSAAAAAEVHLVGSSGLQSLAAPLYPTLDLRVSGVAEIYPRLYGGAELATAVHTARSDGHWVEVDLLLARGEWRLDRARVVPQVAGEAGLLSIGTRSESALHVAYALEVAVDWWPEDAGGLSLGLGVRYLGTLDGTFPLATTWSLRVGYRFGLFGPPRDDAKRNRSGTPSKPKASWSRFSR